MRRVKKRKRKEVRSIPGYFKDSSHLCSFHLISLNHILNIMSPSKSVIMVTGGSGLVGKAIEWVVENDSKYGKREGEEWVFLTSKDGNLV